MIKKITFSLLAILGCTSVFAAHADETPLPAPVNSNVNLVAPSQEGSWSFGVQANYLQANTAFNYAVENTPLADGNYQTKVQTVNADYNWGWGADVTYHFAGNGRDVTLAYTQLNTSNSDVVTDASATVKSNYKAADLSFGQLIAIGDRISLHPFAGLRYTDIDYKTSAQNNSRSADGTFIETINSQNAESEFQGVGPRFGSDVAVNLGGGFSLQGTLGMSLLVGNMNPSLSYNTLYSTGISPTTSVDTNVDMDSSTRVVPETDAKLGALYTIDFNSGYALGIEAGYQVSNYFNAVQNSSGSMTDTSTEYSNFFLQGPYARLQLDIA